MMGSCACQSSQRRQRQAATTGPTRRWGLHTYDGQLREAHDFQDDHKRQRDSQCQRQQVRRRQQARRKQGRRQEMVPLRERSQPRLWDSISIVVVAFSNCPGGATAGGGCAGSSWPEVVVVCRNFLERKKTTMTAFGGTKSRPRDTLPKAIHHMSQISVLG